MKFTKEIIELSIIIVNFNSGNYLSGTISSIYKNRPKISFEIIVVDNNSNDDSLANAKKDHREIIIIELSENFGFAKANNIGVKKSKGKYILVLNNDTEILNGSIDSLISLLDSDSKYGIVAPLILFGDNTPQLSFGRDPEIISEFITKYFSKIFFKIQVKFLQDKFAKNVDWISGACFLIRRELYNSLGGFDEKFFLYYEDCDFGRRVRDAGYLNRISSDSRIIHHLGKSRRPPYYELLLAVKKGHLYYYRKHNTRFSFIVLKTYLTLKFNFKRIYSYLRTDKTETSEIDKFLSFLKKI